MELYWRDWERNVELFRQFTRLHIFFLYLRVQNTNEILDKTVLILLSQILQKKMADKGPPKTLKKNIAKKKPKHEIVHNLWWIPRPKRFILSNIWSHFSTGKFFLSFNFCFICKTPVCLETWRNYTLTFLMRFSYWQRLFEMLENS